MLFEVAGSYDSGPLYQMHQMRFSDRMIAMMDGSSAWWALRWLAGADDLSLLRRLTLGSEILSQLVIHASHIGFFWNSAPVDKTAYYDPGATPPPTRFSDQDAAELLDRAAAELALKPEWPSDVPTRWMSAFLAEEISILQRHGVERFAFYSVPSMQGANVAYARRFCAAISNVACIVGEDPELLADLRHGADWYDIDHLQGHGREVCEPINEVGSSKLSRCNRMTSFRYCWTRMRSRVPFRPDGPSLFVANSDAMAAVSQV